MIDFVLRLQQNHIPPMISGKADSIVFVYDPQNQGDNATWQQELSRWIVKNRCRHMTAFGLKSTTWEDAVDWADIERNHEQFQPEDICVTDFFDTEELEEALEFWFRNMRNDDRSERTIILDLSTNDPSIDWELIIAKIMNNP
jgi:hypothetical protein